MKIKTNKLYKQFLLITMLCYGVIIMTMIEYIFHVEVLNLPEVKFAYGNLIISILVMSLYFVYIRWYYKEERKIEETYHLNYPEDTRTKENWNHFVNDYYNRSKGEE